MKIEKVQSELIKKLNSEYKTSDEISEQLGIPKQAIIKHLKNLKCKNITSKNFYNLQIKHDYFDNIDTPEKAYILGILASDGNIAKNMIRLRIHPKDIEIINFIRQEVNYLKEPRINKNSYGTKTASLSFRSSKIKDSLFRLGFSYNKTYSNLFIPVTDNLTRYFILGLFDGDGSIFYTKFVRKSGPRSGEQIEKYRFSYTGNTITGNELKTYFDKLGIDLKLYPLKKNPKICSLQVSKNEDMIKLYNYLYENNQLGLQRKRELFKESFTYYNGCSTTTISTS
jgi:biotin operon repressor